MPTDSGPYGEAGRAAQPGTRASDADRDRVVETLRVALGDGRLTPEEFDERMSAALAARTLDELPALTADLGAVRGGPVPAVQAADVDVIKERHSIVQRTGRWVVPRRLDVKTAWCEVTLDFTEAVITHDTLDVHMRLQGGTLTLVTAPGIVIDPNELRVKHGLSQIAPGAPGVEPRLVVRLIGRMKHGLVQTRTAGD